ncbi:hypothetical protein DSUL_80028 [Desulfovibrionales bacterium]
MPILGLRDKMVVKSRHIYLQPPNIRVPANAAAFLESTAGI